jgi:small subunit ribosomal protein S17
LTTQSTGRRKRRIGTVVSDKMDKSIVVAFQWTSRHPIYRKSKKRLTKFMAHDENNQATLGDVVLIEESKPQSKTKRWRLVEVLTEREVADIQPTELEPEAGVAQAAGNVSEA